jgi:L-2-hydroxyglutarate oxidase LhgO
MEESKRGFPGFINLIGMESPGLTSCLAIAKYVAEIINK